MNDKTAGWFNDPYGRFQQRYFDGAKWTAHVATGGTQQIDPMGESAVIPIATPATAFASESRTSSAVIGYLNTMAPDSRDRPRPTTNVAVAGLGGLFAAAALFSLIAAEDSSKAKITIAALIALGVGLLVRLLVPAQAELRSAAVGMGAVGIVGFVAGVSGDNFSDTWPLLLTAALLLAAWALPGFRGRPLMLGSGALFLIATLSSALTSAPSCTSEDGFEFCESGDTLFALPDPFNGLGGGRQFVYLLAGAALLWLVWWLDKRGFRGTATPLVISAILAMLIGTERSFSNLGDTAPALLIIGVGVLLCTVGTLGARRATTWWGAFLIATGASALFVSAIEPDSTASITTTLALVAASLIGAPIATRTLLANARKSNSTDSIPPPPPFTTGS